MASTAGRDLMGGGRSDDSDGCLRALSTSASEPPRGGVIGVARRTSGGGNGGAIGLFFLESEIGGGRVGTEIEALLDGLAGLPGDVVPVVPGTTRVAARGVSADGARASRGSVGRDGPEGCCAVGATVALTSRASLDACSGRWGKSWAIEASLAEASLGDSRMGDSRMADGVLSSAAEATGGVSSAGVATVASRRSTGSVTSGVSGDFGDASSSVVTLSRNRSARSSSIALECVFFSATPTSGSNSRSNPGFTSSSRASSLILIFAII